MTSHNTALRRDLTVAQFLGLVHPDEEKKKVQAIQSHEAILNGKVSLGVNV